MVVPEDSQPQPARISRYECHRRLTKVLALVANLCAASPPAGRAPAGGGLLKVMSPPSAGKTSALVTFTPPKAYEMSPSQLDLTGMWYNEAWLRSDLADNRQHLSCYYGTMKGTKLSV